MELVITIKSYYLSKLVYEHDESHRLTNVQTMNTDTLLYYNSVYKMS